MRSEPDHAAQENHSALWHSVQYVAQRLKVANTAIFDWPAEPGITPGATPDGTSATGSLPAIRLYNTDVMGIVLAFDHELEGPRGA